LISETPIEKEKRFSLGVFSFGDFLTVLIFWQSPLAYWQAMKTMGKQVK